MMRVRPIRLLSLVLLSVLLAGAAPAQRVMRVRVGIAAPTVNMLPMWVAEARGFFRANGLAVEIVDTGGGAKGLAALKADHIRAMNVGLSAVIDENGKGGDFRLIASSANTMSFGFFGAQGMTAAALRGGKVGISTPRSESDVAASLALKQLGLMRGDVTVVETGTTGQRLDALLANQIAATALNEPHNIVAERRGLPKLADLSADVPWILNGIVLRQRDAAQNRALVSAFLKAYTEAIHYALANAEETEAILTARFGALDPAIARATYEDFRRRIPRDAAPSIAAAENMLRELPAHGTPVKSTNPADYVDASYIQQLHREGYFTALQTRYRTE